jgi:hypothetical protein
MMEGITKKLSNDVTEHGKTKQEAIKLFAIKGGYNVNIIGRIVNLKNGFLNELFARSKYNKIHHINMSSNAQSYTPFTYAAGLVFFFNTLII